ncbi:MAG: site-2 protease family protein [Caenispirillum bisanense]|nr:site-2 protease family protein [Caenispirillum bisanense]MCA1972685.1 site-2 protease family protein [Caenispirillum sp.]
MDGFMGDAFGWVGVASTWILPVLFAVTFHEAAHGWVADKLGDPTARLAGRISANPLRHVDPFGTVILPALLLLLRAPFLFGWAKPVPVDFRNLRKPRRDMVLVAAAGPGSNLLMASIATALIYTVPLMPHAAAEWWYLNLVNAMTINLVLMAFNLIPLPPLDGGRIAVGLLPRPLAIRLARTERFGILILLGLLFLLPLIGGQIGYDLNVLSWIVGVPVQAMMRVLLTVFGLV